MDIDKAIELVGHLISGSLLAIFSVLAVLLLGVPGEVLVYVVALFKMCVYAGNARREIDLDYFWMCPASQVVIYSLAMCLLVVNNIQSETSNEIMYGYLIKTSILAASFIVPSIIISLIFWLLLKNSIENDGDMRIND